MKTNLLFVALLGSIIWSCSPLSETPDTTLAQRIVQEGKVIEINSSQKVIMLASEYCMIRDCEGFFKDVEPSVQWMSKEDLFMRGINNYLEVIELDQDHSKAKVNRHQPEKVETLEFDF